MKFLRVKKATENVMYFMDSEGHKHTLTLSKEKSSEHPYRLKHSIDDKVVGLESADFESDIKQSIKHIKDTYNKKQATIQQPNKPKPTTMLPDNMEWAWDPDAADWVAVLKDNTNTTPPLYDPNNQNVTNQTTTYMSNIKSASVIDGEEDEDPLSVKLSDLFLSDSSLVDSYIKKEINCDDILNILGIEIKNENEYKEVCNYVKEFIEDNYMRTIKSASSLSVLPRLLDKVWYDYDEETAGKYAQIGSWEIGLGGYDTGYEVSYNGTPIFSITEDNELKPYMSDDRLQKDFGFSYSDVEKALKKHRDLENLKMINASQKDIEEVADSIINTYSGEEELEVLKEYSRKMRKEPIGVFNVMVNNAARHWGLNPNELMGCIMKKDRALVKQIVNLTIEENKKDLDDSVKKLSSKKVKASAKALGCTKTKDGFVVKVMDKDKDIKADITVNVDGNDLSFDSNYKFSNDDDTTFEDFTDTAVWYLVDKGLITFDGNNKWNEVKLSCLSNFLDGPRYSKEIKIEAGLIKNGLVKYAGFDFNRGTKYAITDKGLEVLRKASEKEHNEALNEREKLAYMFGFNTDKETTLDTTGKVIKSEDSEYLDEPFYTSTKPSKKIDTLKELHDFIVSAEVVYFANKPKGISIKNTPEKMQKLKTLKEDIERAKEILNKYNYGNNKNASKKLAKKYTICEADGCELGKVIASSELDAKVKFGIEHPEYADSQSICAKEIKADLNHKGRFEYHNYKIDLFDDTDGGATFVIYAPEDKTVNHEKMYKGTALNLTQAIDKSYKIINRELGIVDAKYEETTEQHLDYPNPSETPTTDVILENHDGWVNTAEQKVTPEFAQLHSILGEYKKNGHILSITQDGKDLLVSCSPIASYEMKQKFEQLGYECEETDESETGDAYDLPSYTLRIKMK